MCLFFEGKNHTKIAISEFGMLDRWLTKLEGTISIHWRQEKAKLTIETLGKCEKYPKLTIKTPGRRYWRRSGVLIVNFEHISDLFLMLLLLALNKQMLAGFTTIATVHQEFKNYSA